MAQTTSSNNQTDENQVTPEKIVPLQTGLIGSSLMAGLVVFGLGKKKHQE